MPKEIIKEATSKHLKFFEEKNFEDTIENKMNFNEDSFLFNPNSNTNPNNFPYSKFNNNNNRNFIGNQFSPNREMRMEEESHKKPLSKCKKKNFKL